MKRRSDEDASHVLLFHSLLVIHKVIRDSNLQHSLDRRVMANCKLDGAVQWKEMLETSSKLCGLPALQWAGETGLKIPWCLLSWHGIAHGLKVCDRSRKLVPAIAGGSLALANLWQVIGCETAFELGNGSLPTHHFCM